MENTILSANEVNRIRKDAVVLSESAGCDELLKRLCKSHEKLRCELASLLLLMGGLVEQAEKVCGIDKGRSNA
jgi:hypothetical protein